MDDTKFKQFEITITEKTDRIQIEQCNVGERRMIIATNLNEIRPKTYRQEAYGPARFSEEEIPEIVAELKKRLGEVQ